MFKKLRDTPVSVAAIILMLAFVVMAAKPAGITHLTSLWVGDATDTADVTPAANDLFVSGTAEIDGATRIDGAVDVNGAMDVSGNFTSTTTRSFPLDLAGGAVDGAGDIDESDEPDITECDNLPCIVWADSSEVNEVRWTFRLPSDFSSGLVVYALVSSNATGAGTKLDWAVYENIDDTAFDATAIPQAVVTSASVLLSTKNDVLTLTSDATAETAYTAGDWITLEFFNGSTDDNDLELKGLEVTYTAVN